MGHLVAALAIVAATLSVGTQPQVVDPRLEQAIAWYTGTAGRVDDDRAHRLMLEAIEDGDAVSQMWLARCHSRGRMGFERSGARANTIAAGVIDTIRQLAESGLVEAVFLMGTAYDEGLGVTADPGVAAGWFQRAATQGHVLGQHNLGNAYADGRGVAQNDALAVQWWRKAAEAGDAIPQLRLARMYEEGRGVPTDLALATEWYRRAAARGNAQAADALRPWTPAGIKNGVTLAYRDDPAVEAREVRATADLPFAAQRVFDVVCDQTQYQSIVSGLKEVRLLSGTVPTDYELYFRYAAQFAVVAARDVAVRVQSVPGASRIGCRWSSLPDRVPTRIDAVRMPLLRGSWFIEAVDGASSRVVYQVTADPGGRLPAWLVRRGTLGTLPDLLEQVKRRLLREGVP